MRQYFFTWAATLALVAGLWVASPARASWLSQFLHVTLRPNYYYGGPVGYYGPAPYLAPPVYYPPTAGYYVPFVPAHPAYRPAYVPHYYPGWAGAGGWNRHAWHEWRERYEHHHW